MSRSCGGVLAAASVFLVLAVTASAILPTDEEPQDDKRVLVAAGDAHGLQKEETDARLAAAAGVEVAALPMEGKPGGGGGGGVAIQGEDPGSVPSGSGGGNGSGSGSASGGEHRKEDGGSGSSKEGEKAAKSCLSKEECHKKRLLCGKGCTLSAHAKCATKCSKSCVPTC